MSNLIWLRIVWLYIQLPLMGKYIFYKKKNKQQNYKQFGRRSDLIDQGSNDCHKQEEL